MPEGVSDPRDVSRSRRHVMGTLQVGPGSPFDLARSTDFLLQEPDAGRLDYVAPISQEHAFCPTTEKLLGVAVPKRGQLITIMELPGFLPDMTAFPDTRRKGIYIQSN